ncbi:MAG: M50 family metallopeptidase [Rhabdochlamydiaceae bacterium]|nr:M50 family metallopeptidase [Rhabdochlamydiaceae bacterium]
MLHFSGRIPLTIYPAFWIFSGLIGFWISESLFGTVLWMGIIFVSVLFHEYGHALTALLFGKQPRIELVAMGGLTYHDGQKLAFWKQFLIVFNGPLFGFLLFLAATFLLQIPSLSNGLGKVILMNLRNVNLFWTVVNLLPVLPLDGGQLLRIVLEGFFGVRGFRYALIGSMAIGVLASLFFFLAQALLPGALFFLLAFQSFDAFRKSRHFSEKDRDESLRSKLAQAELWIQEGRKEEALELLAKIRSDAKEGMLYTAATQYTALLMYDQGRSEQTYQLLLSIREELSPDALCLLHKTAFENKNYPLVAELAGRCFQTWPTAETALRNAYAHAALAQVVPTVGWLQTAIQEGAQNLAEVLHDPSFDPVRNDPAFQQLIASLQK